MRSVNFFSLGAFIFAVAVQAQDAIQWTISNVHLQPDGFDRAVVAVNGQFPGPTLSFTKGENPMINVTNVLEDTTMRASTSIHWHGIFQPNNAFNDGPSFVTQCPISPGRSYLYQLQNGNQAGTFWYHSHLSAQYLDGLRGPLIIRDPADPHINLYDVDTDEQVVFLADWFHSPGEELLATFAATGTEQLPISGTLNGRGSTAETTVEPPVFTVEKGKRYRFRIINGSAIAIFKFQLQGHNFTVIEADGESHKPFPANVLTLWPGQRYSIVVQADQEVGNYWMRTPMLSNAQQTLQNSDRVNGILRYVNAPVESPGALPIVNGTWSDAGLEPLDEPTPPASTRTINLALRRSGGSFTINNVQFKPPTVPTLLQILSNNKTAWTPEESTERVERGEIIDLHITGAPNHPIHLHGHSFWVVKGSSDSAPRTGPTVRRDVAAGSNDMIIRFRADNPGPWIIHCHIDLHLDTGFAYVLAEAPETAKQSMVPSAQWFDLCKAYDALDPSLQ